MKQRTLISTDANTHRADNTLRLIIICCAVTFTAGCETDYYLTESSAYTEQIQTFGDSLLDYSKPLDGFCARKDYGGVPQTLDCNAEVEQQALAVNTSTMKYRDNSKTGAELRAIRADQFLPELNNSNLKTAIFNGGANDLSRAGCKTEATTGTRDYSRIRLSDAATMGTLLNQKTLAEINQSYVVMGEALDVLSDSELDQYIALVKQPISTRCVTEMARVTSMLQTVVNAADNRTSLQHLVLTGSPYFNIYTNNQTDYSSALQSRLCRTSSKCVFVDPRVLWLSVDAETLNTMSRSVSTEECHSRIDEPEFTGTYCYPDDFTWDQEDHNVHFNGEGAYMIGNLIYEKMKAVDACRLPGEGSCKL